MVFHSFKAHISLVSSFIYHNKIMKSTEGTCVLVRAFSDGSFWRLPRVKATPQAPPPFWFTNKHDQCSKTANVFYTYSQIPRQLYIL